MRSVNPYIRFLIPLVLFGWIVSGSHKAFAQLPATPASIDSAAPKPYRQRAILPLIGYLPETKFSAGVVAIQYFKAGKPGIADSLNRISNLRLLMLYTQTRQITANLSGNVYLMDDRLWLDGGIAFYRLPYDFYGIGNSTPKSNQERFIVQYPRIKLNAMWRVRQHLYTGLGYLFERDQMRQVVPDGLLAEGTIAGSRGGRLSGPGALLSYDSRDNNLSARKGAFLNSNIFVFQTHTGSSYRYSQFEIDARKYITISKTKVLAAQAMFINTNGGAPFRRLALLGSSASMRGYYPGRYRDKILLAAQTEVRFPLFWRLGMVTFLGAGDVAPRLNSFDLFEFKPTYGAGIRLMVNEKNRLVARFDAAFGKESRGFYFSVGEAF